jgi:hypothetical protein
MKAQETAELPENYYGWNGTTIKHIGKFTDMQDADAAASAAMQDFDIWWIFTDETLRDIAAQANALLKQHADHTVGPVHFPNREVAIPAPAEMWEITFLEKQGETERSSTIYAFGTFSQAESYAEAELLNYYGAVDDMESDDDDESDNESDDDQPELDENGYISDGWVRKATVSSIMPKPAVEIVNLCGWEDLTIDLSHPQYAVIPGPYDYVTKEAA